MQFATGNVQALIAVKLVFVDSGVANDSNPPGGSILPGTNWLNQGLRGGMRMSSKEVVRNVMTALVRKR